MKKSLSSQRRRSIIHAGVAVWRRVGVVGARLRDGLNNACRYGDGRLLIHGGGRSRRAAPPFLSSNINRADMSARGRPVALERATLAAPVQVSDLAKVLPPRQMSHR